MSEQGDIRTTVRKDKGLNPSDFIREAVRENLASIKVIECRDVDYESAKKEVTGVFPDERRGIRL